MTKKVFVSGSNRFGEGRMMSAHGYKTTFNIEEADLVIFTGGADIGPHLYGEPTHATTYPQAYRDGEDCANFLKATSLGIPLLGICRGAQFLCAMTGGKLIQNVSEHSKGDHNIVNKETGEVILTNSVHHQGCVPSDLAIIHWVATHKCLGTYWDEETKKFLTKDVHELAEIFTIPSIKAVAVQGHPEFDPDNIRLTPMRAAVFSLVNAFQPAEAPTPSTV